MDEGDEDDVERNGDWTGCIGVGLFVALVAKEVC